MPLLEKILPIKDTGVRVGRPKKGHFGLGLGLGGGGEITFFAWLVTQAFRLCVKGVLSKVSYRHEYALIRERYQAVLDLGYP